MVLWGTADEVNDIEMAHICNNLIEGSKLVLVEGGDHFIPTNRSEEVNKALLEFLG
jgi:pimeloyl-ACP methyl ester carboxylesterase